MDKRIQTFVDNDVWKRARKAAIDQGVTSQKWVEALILRELGDITTLDQVPKRGRKTVTS